MKVVEKVRPPYTEEEKKEIQRFKNQQDQSTGKYEFDTEYDYENEFLRQFKENPPIEGISTMYMEVDSSVNYDLVYFMKNIAKNHRFDHLVELECRNHSNYLEVPEQYFKGK